MDENDLLSLRLTQSALQIERLEHHIDTLERQNNAILQEYVRALRIALEAASDCYTYMAKSNASYGDAIRATGHYSRLNDVQLAFAKEITLHLITHGVTHGLKPLS